MDKASSILPSTKPKASGTARWNSISSSELHRPDDCRPRITMTSKRTIAAPFDKLREECGVFGIFGHPEAANLTYLGLYALQHRGQESAGIAASDGTQVRISKSMGHVADAFSET